MLPLPESQRAAGRRIAEALLHPLVRGVRAATRRGAPSPAAPAAVPAPAAPTEPPARAPAETPAEAPPRAVFGDDAAARIDEARARLRAKIAPPADD